MPDKFVYLDNAAATRMDARVVQAMLPFFTDKYAVATSQFGYSMGIDAKDALDQARATVASAMGAEPDEFIFLKERKYKGARAYFRERDERYGEIKRA